MDAKREYMILAMIEQASRFAYQMPDCDDGVKKVAEVYESLCGIWVCCE